MIDWLAMIVAIVASHGPAARAGRRAQPVEDVVRGCCAIEDQAACLHNSGRDSGKRLLTRRAGSGRTEMAHIRVEGLGTRDAQEDPSEDEKSATSAGEEIASPYVDRSRQAPRGTGIAQIPSSESSRTRGP